MLLQNYKTIERRLRLIYVDILMSIGIVSNISLRGVWIWCWRIFSGLQVWHQSSSSWHFLYFWWLSHALESFSFNLYIVYSCLMAEWIAVVSCALQAPEIVAKYLQDARREFKNGLKWWARKGVELIGTETIFGKGILSRVLTYILGRLCIHFFCCSVSCEPPCQQYTDDTKSLDWVLQSSETYGNIQKRLILCLAMN